MIARTYGVEPFVGTLIHGGPGAGGSLAGLAAELGKTFGVIEAIQSRLTIPGLVEELYGQITSVTRQPQVLVGHSWGAWLAVLFAGAFPAFACKLVLTGCAPFKPEYVPLIKARRLKRLSPADAAMFQGLLTALQDEATENKDAILKRLGELVEKADNYEAEGHHGEPPDGRMYAAIWPQADRMRQSGELAEALQSIRCTVLVIHGEHDPHPLEGVVEPLREQGLAPEIHVLPECGHSPFNERRAAGRFYQLLSIALRQKQELP